LMEDFLSPQEAIRNRHSTEAKADFLDVNIGNKF
jgi:hypothetical protein